MAKGLFTQGMCVLLREPVEVDGAGEGDDGTYYVDRVTHTFSQTGYRQEFRLLRNARGRTGAATREDPLAAVRT